MSATTSTEEAQDARELTLAAYRGILAAWTVDGFGSWPPRYLGVPLSRPPLFQPNLAGVFAVSAIATAALAGLIAGRSPTVRRNMVSALIALVVYGGSYTRRMSVALGDADRFVRFIGLLALAYGVLRVSMTVGVDIVVDRETSSSLWSARASALATARVAPLPHALNRLGSVP